MVKQSYFHDPVHGHIYLNPLERAVVDSIEFQRLRFIRQNSLLHYVFPGAFHPRFAHCIGASHNAQRLIKQLFKTDSEFQSGYALSVFRLASLLHDVGHGAFSHLLSYVNVGGRSFLPTLAEVIHQGSKWNLNTDPKNPIFMGIQKYFAGEESHPIEHEALSVLIIARIFKNLSTSLGVDIISGVPHEVWAQDIAALILPTIAPSSTFIKDCAKLASSLSDLPKINDHELIKSSVGEDLFYIFASLVSGTIDVDRMDYLIRDSQTCGVNYGLFDDVGLISALDIVIDEGHLKLGLNTKRTNTLDDYLWSRYQMFKQIYCHKTHNAYNVLLQLAMNDLCSMGLIQEPKNLNDYLKLTDDFIMSRVFEFAQSHPEKHSWPQAFAQRKLPQLLGIVEANLSSPVWKKTAKQIYETSDFEKYPGWQGDPFFVSTTQKTEIIRTAQDTSTLPTVYSFDKTRNKFKKESYLNKSVFFNPELKSEYRIQELCDRLNRKLIYFYRYH